MIVEPNVIGTAFGLTACLMNLLYFTVPILIGIVITDDDTTAKGYGYTYE